MSNRRIFTEEFKAGAVQLVVSSRHAPSRMWPPSWASKKEPWARG
ncbi:hypothetical protein [Corynebacterium glutamicum]|nr:hypothetical protein [Corynebacterium glutamicum]